MAQIPSVKYYEAGTKKEVTAMVKEEFPDCKTFIVIETLTPQRGARHPETKNLGGDYRCGV